MQPSYSAFERFVMAQDASKTIDHENWDTCAVGDYLKEYNIKKEDTGECMSELFGKYDYENTTYLGNSKHVKVGNALNIGHSNVSLKTYGDLQEFIIDID